MTPTKLGRHHRLRQMTGLTSKDEYVLAVLQEEGEIKVTFFRHVGVLLDGLKRLLDRLVKKGYIRIRMVDKKTKFVSLTELGVEYIKQVEDIYAID